MPKKEREYITKGINTLTVMSAIAFYGVVIGTVSPWYLIPIAIVATYAHGLEVVKLKKEEYINVE